MAMHMWAVAEAAAEKAPIKARSEAVGYAAGVTTWMLAGSVFAAVKLVSDEMPPWTMCFFRVLLSALFLTPLVYPHRHDIYAFVRKRGLEAMFIGAIGLGLTQGVMFTALSHTSAINVGIVFALAPMITHILARLVLHEPMNGWQVLGSAIAFSGIEVISVQGSLARLMGLQFGFGEVIALGAACMFACYTVLLKRAKFELPLLPMLVVLLFSGSAAAFPFFVWEYVNGEHADLALNGYLALLYCALIGGAGVYMCYNWSIEVLGAVRAGTLVYTQMIFVAFFAWLVLGETLEWYHFLGAGLVACGVAVVLLKRPKMAAHPV